MYDTVFKPAVIKYFTMLETYALKSTSNCWILASGLSFADFLAATSVEWINFFDPELMLQFPNLNSIYQNVFSLPQLQDYFNNRSTLDNALTSAMKNMKIYKNNKQCYSFEAKV